MLHSGRFPLQVDLTEKPSFWKALKPPAKNKCGELLTSLCYHPSNSILTLTLLKARNLKAKDINGKSGKITEEGEFELNPRGAKNSFQKDFFQFPRVIFAKSSLSRDLIFRFSQKGHNTFQPFPHSRQP